MDKNNMVIEIKQFKDLKPAEYNPRKDLVSGDSEWEKIKNSIDTFGYVQPILINKDGTIISGHQRYKVMQELGYTEAQCVVVDVDKTTEKAMNVAMNKIDGDWDNQKLLDVLLDLDLNSIDLSLTGFEKSELELLQEEIDKVSIPSEANDDDFDAEEAYENISKPITSYGDIWVLGNHRLMCGDSTKPEDVEELMQGAKADLIITDPPYNVNYGDKAEYLEEYLGKGHRNKSTIKNDNMDAWSFYHFLLDAFTQGFNVARDGAAIYVFHSENEGINFRNAFHDAGWKQSQCLIWEKNTFVLGRQDYQWRHEPVLYGWKEGAAHYFINDRTQDTVLLEDEKYFEDMSKKELLAFVLEMKRQYENITSVQYENKPTRNDDHPTMKPVALIGKYMNNSSKPRWNVLDLFGGGGSTMIAAEQLGRSAYIMELDEKFVDVEVKRYVQYTGNEEVYKISPNGVIKTYKELV
jgi:DNA modification methylase